MRRRTAVLGAVASLGVGVSLSGCALSRDSGVTVATSAQVPPPASQVRSDRRLQRRLDRGFQDIADQIASEVSRAPSYRRQVTRGRASETDGVSLALKQGGLIFLEVKAPLDGRRSARRRLDLGRTREVFVEQQGTPGGAENFSLDITRQRARFDATCEHGPYAVAELGSGRFVGSVFDIGKKTTGYHDGRDSANRLLQRILASTRSDAYATELHARVTAHDDACQAIIRATFGHGVGGH